MTSILFHLETYRPFQWCFLSKNKLTLQFPKHKIIFDVWLYAMNDGLCFAAEVPVLTRFSQFVYLTSNPDAQIIFYNFQHL